MAATPTKTQPGEEPRPADLAADNARLRVSLAELQRDHRKALAHLKYVEERNRSLEGMYVTTYRLHSSLEPADVIMTIDEILLNLVGASSYTVWATNHIGEPSKVLLVSEGGRGELTGEERSFARSAARLGPWFLKPEASRPMGVDAVVVLPLKLGTDAVGVLFIRSLLQHKPELSTAERDVLGLLEEQAGPALESARLHARQRNQP